MSFARAVSVAGAIMLGCGALGPLAAQQNLTLKSADVHPKGYPTVEAVERMGAKLEKATNGRLKIQVYPSMQLGGEKEFLEQAQVGALAMARVSVGVMGPIIPELNVLNLPYLFRDAAHMHKVVDGEIGDELLGKITANEKTGLIGIAWMDGGARNVYDKQRPIAKMEDLKGLKIRTMGNPMFVQMMNEMGGNGVAMGYDQLINGLQTGVVDGAENNEPSYSTGQHYNYAKYYSLTEHLMIPEILVFSKRVWNTLSPDDQKLIKKLGKEAQAEQRALWQEMVKKALADMKANNVVITEVTPEEKKRFQAAVKPVWDKFGADHKAMIERISKVQ